MGRLLLESGIVVLLVLIGISVFIPSSESSTQSIITEFENAVESGEVVEDGEINDVEISEQDDSNFISKLNSRVANAIVNGLNRVFDIGKRILRKVIN